MTITTQDILSGLQILAMLAGFGGMAFTLGRLFQRVDSLAKSHDEIKGVLFGGDGQQGAFVRRSELDILVSKQTGEHEAFDRRLTDFHERLSRLEG